MSPQDLQKLEGQQLELRAIGADDYSVRILDRTAGRIMAKPISGGRQVWYWTVTGPYLPGDLQPSHGEAETLLEAKAAFRARFDRWLTWAVAQEGKAHWMGGPT